MKKCPNCGKENDVEPINFCINCGFAMTDYQNETEVLSTSKKTCKGIGFTRKQIICFVALAFLLLTVVLICCSRERTTVIERTIVADEETLEYLEYGISGSPQENAEVETDEMYNHQLSIKEVAHNRVYEGKGDIFNPYDRYIFDFDEMTLTWEFISPDPEKQRYNRKETYEMTYVDERSVHMECFRDDTSQYAAVTLSLQSDGRIKLDFDSDYYYVFNNLHEYSDDYYLIPTEEVVNQSSNISSLNMSLEGRWEAVQVVIEGESYTDSYICDACFAVFDGSTGYISVDGNKTHLDWEYIESDSDGMTYRVYIGDEYRNIVFVTDSSNKYNNCLVILLDDETAMVFKRA